jgi:hypothetical protein
LSFNSYTFTDISSAFFEQAAKEFERHVDKMEFRPLDIRRDPSEQEFKPNSYDLIIASNVLHATPRLDETLSNVRSLLKPGGRLIVIEVAHYEHTRIGFIFGLFPDWWAGHDEGRVLEPFISYDKWDQVLKKTGFSGVDSRTLDPDSRIFPNGVFATHAIDDLVRRLDSPLTAPIKESYAPLVVIGGSTPKTTALVEKLPGILPARKVETVLSIREIIDFDYQPGSTFIVLSELDQHTFAGLDDEQLDALQTIFNAANNVLWVTEDAWCENPQQAMAIGLLRTLRMEYPDIQIQVLDVDKAENLKPEFLVETIARLEDGANWKDSGILWTQEPELYLTGGKVIVPRLKPDMDKNNRLNSGRRPILADLDPREETLSFGYDGKNPFFKFHEERFVPLAVDESFVKIQVQYSLAKALRVGQLGFFHLIQGRVAGSENTVVVLADANASSVQVPSSRVVAVDSQDEPIVFVLSRILADLVAWTMLSDVAPGSSVLVFEPPSLYVAALSKRAAAANISISFVSTQVAPKLNGIRWIPLHEKERLRSLHQKLPPGTTILYDLSGDQNPTSLSRRVVSRLPPGCSIRRLDYLFQDVATPMSTESSQKASRVLMEGVSEASKLGNDQGVPVLKGNEILSLRSTPEINTVIDWKSDQIIPSRIRSIETDTIFVQDKTYLLVGLAGDLGRSIARFMVERGARHVVLSSRSPKIDQRWIDDITLLGGNVMVLPMQVPHEFKCSVLLLILDLGMPQTRPRSMKVLPKSGPPCHQLLAWPSDHLYFRMSCLKTWTCRCWKWYLRPR